MKTPKDIINKWIEVTELSMGELSRRIGTNPQSVSMWRSGKLKPNSKSMFRLLKHTHELKLSKEEQKTVIREYLDYKGKTINTRSSLLAIVHALTKRVERLEKLTSHL